MAASEKIDSINFQLKVFKPEVIIPCKFIYFSNNKNFYLNDSVNKPSDLNKYIKQNITFINVMKPFDVFDGSINNEKVTKAILYWDEQFKNIKNKTINKFETVNEQELENSYQKYIKRIFSKNNKFLIKLARYLSPIKVFEKINIYLDDLKKTVTVDILSNKLIFSNNKPDLIMSSES